MRNQGTDWLALLLLLLGSTASAWAQFPDTTSRTYLKLPKAHANAEKVKNLNLATTGRFAITDTFGLFKQLRYLDLSHNRLSNFPVDTFKNDTLYWLALDANQLREVPDVSGKWPMLRVLKMGRNPIGEYPFWITKLRNLEVLELANLHFRNLPTDFGQLKKLEVLDLTGNRLMTVPETLRDLDKLRVLSLRNNPLLVEGIKYFLPPNLEYLDISPSVLPDSELAAIFAQNPSLKYINQGYHQDHCKALGDLPAPHGFQRVSVQDNAFGQHLRDLPLKPLGSRVLLFDSTEKREQDLHVAAVAISMSKNDLQQCADLAMRLYADHLWAQNNSRDISFELTNGFAMPYYKWEQGYRVGVSGNRTWWRQTAAADTSYENMLDYLEFVYRYAGSYSLSKSLRKVSEEEATVGDLFVTGGFPGHVAMIGDLAVHPTTGEKVFLLVQGNTPAQELEVVRNLNDPVLSPWFRFPPWGTLLYPRRYFDDFQLMRFD